MINMREGMRTGVVQNRVIVERTLNQYAALTEANVEKNPLFVSVLKMPASFSANDRARLDAAYRKALSGKIIPAQSRLYQFIKNEYLPKTRASAGLGGLPGGAG